MKICLLTANMGEIDKKPLHCEQSIPVDMYDFNDENFPLRYNSFTSRMQARIPKMFSWQLLPDYDYYIWVDSSLTIKNKDTVKWFLEQLGDADIAVFKHPDRQTIRQECDFVKQKIAEKNYYLFPRYANEFLEEQMNALVDYDDNFLIASSAFIYKNSPKIQAMFKEWWYHTSRYTTQEQLSLPYVLTKSGCKFNIIDKHYMKTPYLTYTGHKK